MTDVSRWTTRRPPRWRKRSGCGPRGRLLADVRAHLTTHGVSRSYHGVQALLQSRIPLGELRFGELLNEHAHTAIVDEDTWRRVQRMEVPRGRRPKSERLLARLGVLRCGTCGARMVVGFRTDRRYGRRYDFYRCPPVGDCPRRVTISADVVEQKIVEAVKTLLSGTCRAPRAPRPGSRLRVPRLIGSRRKWMRRFARSMGSTT